jgi:two-component system OmpR family sensor kinase
MIERQESPGGAARKSVPWSITARLIAGLGAGLCGLWLVATGLSALATLREINEVFDSALQETAQRLQPLIVDHLLEHGGSAGTDLDDAVMVPRHHEYLLYQVRDAGGDILLRSHDAPQEAFPAPLQPGFVSLDGRRYYTEATTDSRLFVQVTETPGHRREALWDSLVWLALPLTLLLPLTGFLITWVVRRGTAPIAALGVAIGERGGNNLSLLAEDELPVSPIVRDINRLLLRLRLALEHERSFAANSAHELRTPVAAALAQIQRLTAELPESSQRQRTEQIQQALRRLANLVEKLLQLSRAESGSAMASDEQDLAPIVDLVLDDYHRRPDIAARLSVIGRAGWRAVSDIDIDAFAIVLRNLLDNALRHGDGGSVELHLEPEQRIRIVNGGEIVPSVQLSHLTDRFARGKTTAAGSGLGLSIVRTILDQIGYRLELKSPATGKSNGFEAIIDLRRA